MDQRKIQVFLRVADTGNLTHAAEALSFTQSAVTQIIGSLERELELQLFVRSNRGVRLTPEGERLLPLMRAMNKQGERIHEEAALLRGVEVGTIRLGSFSSISVNWLPQILRIFGERYPGIQVEVLEDAAEPLMNWLRDGLIDLCFFNLDPDNSFENIELQTDPLYAILPKGHPLSTLPTVPVSRLFQEPYILLKSALGPEPDLENLLQYPLKGVNVRFSSNYDLAVIGMVEAGLGVSIMTGLILKGHDRNLEVRPLDPPSTGPWASPCAGGSTLPPLWSASSPA